MQCKYNTNTTRYSLYAIQIQYNTVHIQNKYIKYSVYTIKYSVLAVVPVLRTGSPTFLIHFQPAFLKPLFSPVVPPCE